jgi:amino acid transporter/nucleotide-binding universal stress UspA family protein
MAVAREEVRVELSRDLGLTDITMIGIGAMIGAGIFVLIGSAVGAAGPAAIVALVLNGIVTAITAMAYAELGSSFPTAGSVYVWAKEALPPPAGFFSGWTGWMATILACSLYAVGFGSFLVFTLGEYGLSMASPLEFLLVKGLAIAVVLSFVFVNYWGAQTTGKTEGIITITKVVVLGVFVMFGLAAMIKSPDMGERFLGDFAPFGSSGILMAMGLTFVAFEGYEIIAQSGEEVKNPKRNIPRAIFISLIVVVIIYVLVFIVALGVIDISQECGGSAWACLGQAENPELAMIRASGSLLGSAGVLLMVAGGLLATTSALNATVYSSSRVSFAMGRDGVIPRAFGTVHRKRRTPSSAVIASGVIIIGMAMLPQINQIAAAAGIMFLLLFLMANASVISLRRSRPDLDRGFRMPLVPFLPVLGIVLNIVLATAIWFLPGEGGGPGPGQVAWYVALAWIVAGLIIHYPAGGKREIETIPETKRVELLEILAGEEVARARPRRRILVPVKDVTNQNLIRLASVIARERGARLEIMNVVEVPLATPPKAIGFSTVDNIIKDLKKLERLARREKVEASALVKIAHKVDVTIAEEAEKGSVDLLIIGWRGSPTGRAIMGSNIDYLVQRAPCDVALAKTTGMKERLGRILVMSGHTWHTTHATALAAQIARRHDAEVTIFTVTSDPSREESDMRYARRLEDICEQAGARHRSKAVKSRSVIPAVLKEAKKHDLLVLGASAGWALKQYAFGPLEDRLARRATIPVLMLRKVGEHDLGH